MKEQSRKIYCFADFRLDANNRQLRRDNKPLSLPPKAFDLLLTLVENNGRLVEKDEIFSRVWQDQIVEESNLTVYISQIRKRLSETKKNPRFIETVPGYGYRFIGEVSEFENEEFVIEAETPERIAIEDGTESQITDYELNSENEPEFSNGAFQTETQFEIEPHKTGIGEIQRTKDKGQRTNQFLIVGGIIGFLALAFGGNWFFKNWQNDQSSAAQIISPEKHPKIKRLTNHGRVNTAILSPDGRFFAYTFKERGSYRTELRLGQTDGGTETILKPLGDFHYTPRDFSADGSWLYYIATETLETKGILYKIPVLGGAAQKLADGVEIYTNISPDEKQIAFVRNNNKNKTSALIIAHLDGSTAREIAVRPQNLSFVPDSQAWSTDGRFIALSAVGGANRKNASSQYYEVFVVRIADGFVEQLTSLEWNGLDALEWLKDGSGLLAVAKSSEFVSTYQLWHIDYPGEKARLLSRDPNTYGGELSLSADSNNLLVTQREVESNIWIAPADNIKEARQITFSSSGRLDGWFGMDWTPDGQIVHTAWIDQNLTIWKMDALGANPVQLTSVGFRDEKPAVSPDGQWIAFQSNRSGATEIWRVSIDGNDLRQLTNGGGNTHPSISPDGKQVIYRHSGKDGNSIRIVSANGGEAVKIIHKDLKIPRISPDGKFLAAVYAVEGKEKLAVFSIEGGEPVKLFDVPKTNNFRYWLCWSADGKFISYPDGANGIWRQSLSGGDPVRIENLPEDKTYAHSWARDGKQLAFGRVREVRDAVLITDFR